MLVPAVRASTAWLPTVLLVDVVVLIKKRIRHLVDQGNDTPHSLVCQPREKRNVRLVSRFRFGSTLLGFSRASAVLSCVQRVWSRDTQSVIPARNKNPTEREGRREVRAWQTTLRSSSWSVVRRSRKLVHSATMLLLPSLPKRGDGVHCGRSPHTEDSWRHEPTTRRWSRERAFRAGARGAAISIDTSPLHRYTYTSFSMPRRAPVYRRRSDSTPLVSTYDQRPSNGLTVDGGANT